MVLIGKLATHEFATGGPAWDLPFPPARNPWNTDAFHRRVEFRIGGGGRRRHPASGDGQRYRRLDPPAGGVLRHGRAEADLREGQPARRRAADATASTRPGRLTWTVEDAALALQALAGYDRRDPGSADVTVPDYRAALRHGVAGLRIGYARDFSNDAGVGVETKGGARQRGAGLGQTRGGGGRGQTAAKRPFSGRLPSRFRIANCSRSTARICSSAPNCMPA